MTLTQLQAVWELCRQGLPLAADEATDRWNSGQPFSLDTGIHVSRYVENLIEQANWEIARPVEPA